MRWLLHGKLTPAVSEALTRHGHVVSDPATVGVAPDTDPEALFKAAQKAQLDVLTDDPHFAEAPFSPDAPPFARSLVYLRLEGDEVEQDDAIDRLFQRYKRLTPGRLYTVTGSRVKVRQLPGKPG